MKIYDILLGRLFDARNSKSDVILNIVKITLISFVAIFLIGNFNPFFETVDGYGFGIFAKYFSQGNFFYTNELVGTAIEFLPPDMMLTNDGKNLLYVGYAGFSSLTTLTYTLAGNHGLFYLGPITGILFLVTVERFSSHFFGKYVGLLALLFVATNHFFYRSALNLQTESIFGIFFLLGCYCLIKFFKGKSTNHIFFASMFFVISSLIRTNGIVYFPIEIALLAGFFVISKYQSKISSNDTNPTTSFLLKFSSLNKKKFIKIFSLALIPWIVFLLFWFSFYGYYFDNPFSHNAYEEKGTGETGGLISSIFSLEAKNFENLKEYSKWFLPYQFPRTVDTNDGFSDVNSFLGNNWLGIVSILLLMFFTILSFVRKKHRLTTIIFAAMIMSTAWFFGAISSEKCANCGLPGRWMLPAFTLYSMLLGMIIINFYHSLNFKKYINTKFSKILKTSFIIFLTIFFLSAFYFSPPGSSILKSDFEIKDPFEINLRYPLDKEGLTNNDVLVGYDFEALDYGLISFQPEISLKEGKISPESFDVLKATLKDNYDVFLLKHPTEPLDKISYNLLAQNSDFIIKDYSESFCKVELITKDQKDSNQSKHDVECLNYQN